MSDTNQIIDLMTTINGLKEEVKELKETQLATSKTLTDLASKKAEDDLTEKKAKADIAEKKYEAEKKITYRVEIPDYE